MSIVPVLAALIFGALGFPSPAVAGAALEHGTSVGQLFPDTPLPSLEDGRPVSVSRYRGRKILLFQFASW